MRCDELKFTIDGAGFSLNMRMAVTPASSYTMLALVTFVTHLLTHNGFKNAQWTSVNINAGSLETDTFVRVDDVISITVPTSE